MSSKILSLGAMYFQIGSIHFPLSSDSLLNKEIVGSDYIIDPGGSAINLCLVSKNLGLQPVFIGKMGNDVPGQELARMLEKAGVELIPIISSDYQTNLALNFSDDKGDSIMFVSGTANQSLKSEEVLEKIKEQIKNVQYLYLGGTFKLKSLLPAYKEIIQLAHDNNVKVLLDHGRVTNVTTEEDKEIVRKIIPEIDYYLPSHEELMGVLGVDTLEEAITAVQSLTKHVVAIKNSVNGAIGIQNKEIVKVPVYPVEVINIVGAGDSFNAGFISAIDKGFGLEDSLRFGCATSALKISQLKYPTFEEVKILCQMN